MTSAIEVVDATVHYGDVLALDGVSLTVEPGRICGLLGTNGSGKSTLFKTILGLTRPDRGRVRLLGMDGARARRKGLVGYVPQTEQVDWDFPLSVHDVVMMGRYGHMGIRRRPRPADRDAVARALARTDLTDLARRRIGALSGGQRKRAFVARALAQGADVLLLDEPFAGVDKRSEATITDLLRRLRDEGRTLLVSTHDLAQVPGLCDEAVLLQRRVIARGTPAEVLHPEIVMEAFGVHVGEESGSTWTR
ncbi:metal ABC transporter ATP-binding protein [Nocardiopsis sp. N85]|uniref:metal ABC transporter ATP-binding protein n=1 Tax=Nocardiopsis sp. N85 TaxID=3029400 RepID=UPI00237F2E8E|nr:metal ABC transporter ATP-binding protein [Nocardiopsis sp. N85]MDE3722180.1 metal ABC transporter ATP-binding protein [Nocardiopsis sp. N85]